MSREDKWMEPECSLLVPGSGAQNQQLTAQGQEGLWEVCRLVLKLNCGDGCTMLNY